MRHIVLSLGSFLFLGTLLAPAQELVDSPSTSPFKADARLVLVPVTVTDKKGAAVPGLTRDGFQVFEDKINQGIYSFTEQDAPVSLGVVLDVSGSMQPSLNDAKTALHALLDAANPADEAFLFTVAARPVKNSGFTSDFASLASDVLFTPAHGSTSLVDTAYQALHEFHSARYPRRGLVIISDGMDNHSRYTKAELMSEALEANVQIFTISLYTPPGYLKAIQLRTQREGLFFLGDLADKTGGVQFVARNFSDISKAAADIGLALRNEYIIGYIPRSSSSRPLKWHAIDVKLNSPGLKAHARCGYYSE